MRHVIPRFLKLAVSLGITGLFAIWCFRLTCGHKLYFVPQLLRVHPLI